jgi:hypothetical protein
MFFSLYRDFLISVLLSISLMLLQNVPKKSNIISIHEDLYGIEEILFHVYNIRDILV